MNTATFDGALFNPPPALAPAPGGGARGGFNAAAFNAATFGGAAGAAPPVSSAGRKGGFNAAAFNTATFGGAAATLAPPVLTGLCYHLYGNNAAGGPVDYTTPIGTTNGLTFSPPPLAAPSDNRFAVRAFDADTGLEERNIDAVVRIVIDAAGNDITAQPNPPLHLAARPTANGRARVEWDYNAAGQGGPPTGFRVWRTAGGAVDYSAAPALIVAYIPGVVHSSVDLAGLADAVLYSIGVRAYNASATEANTNSVRVTGKASGPAAVEDLMATATA